MPITIERGRAGIRLTSRDHGASPRAAPSPPATRASRKAAITACSSEERRDGGAAGHRQRASASSAYGNASAIAA